MAEPLLRLRDTVTVSRATAPDEPTLLVQGSRMLRIRSASRELDAALTLLQEGVEELVFAQRHQAKDVQSLVETLSRLGWLTGEPPHAASDAIWDRQVGWWSALTSDGQSAQRRLAAANVAVLGMGGVGALVAQHLVAGGVRRLWLLDHDTVAAHNLNRQYLYQRADIGRFKAEAAAAALARVADGLELHPVRIEVTAAEHLEAVSEQVDLLVVAADRPADLMDSVWAWACPRGVPVLGAGIGLELGYWGPLLDPRRSHCWPCFEQGRLARLSADERRLEAEGAPTPYSFGPTNAIIADHVARDAMLFLGVGRCASLGRRQVMDVLGVAPGASGDSDAPQADTGGRGQDEHVPGCPQHVGSTS